MCFYFGNNTNIPPGEAAFYLGCVRAAQSLGAGGNVSTGCPTPKTDDYQSQIEKLEKRVRFLEKNLDSHITGYFGHFV